MTRSDPGDETARSLRHFFRRFGAEYVAREEGANIFIAPMLLQSLIERGFLVARGDRIALSADALRVASLPDDAPVPAAVPDQSMDAVTRSFLEEVLAEAEIPRDLMDVIVSTYQIDGELSMSEDGRRYVIHLRRIG